jgi:flagellin-specific chaperone FliS
MIHEVPVADTITIIDGVEKICHRISVSIEYKDSKPNSQDIEIAHEIINDLNRCICPECGKEIHRFEIVEAGNSQFDLKHTG